MSDSPSDPTPVPGLHDLEAEVMHELWANAEMTVRATHEAINERTEQQRAYTTILTVLRRLAAKGFLERRRSGKTDHYRSLLSAEEYAAARARAGAGALVEEFGDAALAHFALTLSRLDPERRAALERLAQGS